MLEGIELTPKGLKEVYKDKKVSEQSELDFQLLEHESPVVRAFVYDRVTRNYNENTEDLQRFVAQLKSENDPLVVAAGIKSLFNNLKVSAELYNFVKSSAQNANANVRANAALALCNSNNKMLDGIFDEALKLLNDSDKDVRKNVCKYLPAFGNEAIVPKLAQILSSNDENDLAIHGDCLDGLVSMWYNYPMFDRQSEAAYLATLNYLKTTPRSKKVPAWNGMSKLGNSADKKPAWKEAATYFNANDVVAVMSEIAKDSAADVNARKAAIKSVAALGSKEDLETLNNAIEDADKLVKKAVLDALAKK